MVCTGSLDGHRAHALTCSGPCRAERSRLRRILDGQGADGARSVAEHQQRAQKRTRAALGASPSP